MGIFSRRNKITPAETSGGQAQQSSDETPSSAAFPDGVKVWVDCPNATVDICFVHGLTGDRDDTWTANGQSEPWPKTLLPKALLPQQQHNLRARILTYGYDAYVVRKSTASTNRLREHADNLLNDLVMDRDMNGGTSRPLIFVAHSLGGLVCKKAVLASRSHPDKHLQDLFQSLRGIVFMGTPHKGSWMASWAKFPAAALKVFKSTNASILDILETKNQLLQDIQDDFWAMIREQREGGRRLDVSCFFEELPIAGVGLVVEKGSATLEGYHHASIHAHHGDMVKFDSLADNGFKRLLYELVRWGRREVATETKISGCLRSLAFPEMRHRMNDISPETQGTLSWLSQHAIYKDWSASDRAVLWIRGKPGSGKSTLMRHALTAAESLSSHTLDDIVLSFFFHGRGTELQKTPLGLYRSLLHQIVSQAPEAAPELVNYFEQHNIEFGSPGEKWYWHKHQLWELLKAALERAAASRKVWLFIDALDETEETDAVNLICNLSSLVEGLPSNSGCGFCFSSRHYPILARGFKFTISLEDENAQDISKFIQEQLSPFSGTKIPEIILERASGVFIWVRLVVERVLRLERQGEQLEKIEAEVKVAFTDLDELYIEILEKIRSNPASVKLFEWVGFALWPLSPTELCSAIDPDSTLQLTKDPDKMNLWLGNLSGGLAEISQQSVQFIHQSFKDFYCSKGLAFLSGSIQPAPQLHAQAHERISRFCFQYWNEKSVVDAITQHKSLRALVPKVPLLLYATHAWGHHARQSEKNGADQSYLLDTEHFDWPSSDRYRTGSWSTLENGLLTDGSNILHVLAQYGLVKLLHSLILQSRRNGRIDFDPRDRRGRTPFIVAAEYGHTSMVKGLSGTPQIDFNAASEMGTALCAAIMGWHNDIVELLLSKGKVPSGYYEGSRWIPASSFADYYCNTVAMDLLNKYDQRGWVESLLPISAIEFID
ncbi:hypothetical protein CC79DRAFT_1389020 [Sarocladium strictum]